MNISLRPEGRPAGYPAAGGIRVTHRAIITGLPTPPPHNRTLVGVTSGRIAAIDADGYGALHIGAIEVDSAAWTGEFDPSLEIGFTITWEQLAQIEDLRKGADLRLRVDLTVSCSGVGNRWQTQDELPVDASQWAAVLDAAGAGAFVLLMVRAPSTGADQETRGAYREWAIACRSLRASNHRATAEACRHVLEHLAGIVEPPADQDPRTWSLMERWERMRKDLSHLTGAAHHSDQAPGEDWTHDQAVSVVACTGAVLRSFSAHM